MHKMLTAAAACMAGMCLAGNTYYVDAVNGDDTWDGSTATIPTEEQKQLATVPGPRKTLVGVLQLAKKNNQDVIYAAEGDYCEGAYTNSALHVYRAYLPSFTRLVASGRRDHTFIRGESSTDEAADKYGNGPGAVGCVMGSDNNHVVGFTICDGRKVSTNTGSTDNNGAGCKSVAFVVDCVVSNNCSPYRGGACSGGNAIRCLFTENRCPVFGSAMNGGTAYNCVMVGNIGDVNIMNGTAYNTTMLPGTTYTARNSRLYNCLGKQTDDNGNTIYNSVSLGNGPNRTNTRYDCLTVAAKDLLFDDDYRPILGSNPGIDYGSNGCYTISSTYADQKWLDFYKAQRIFNGKIDCGAVEYDWCAAFGAILSEKDVTVTAADPAVCTNGLGGVAITNGTSLALVWAYPGGEGAANFRFRADVTGASTLTVTRGAETLLTITASGDYAFTGTDDQTLTFAAAGDAEGSVAVSSFAGTRNCVTLALTDAEGGLTAEGLVAGENEILPGETKTFTVSRNWNSADLCTGVNVDGEFFAFTGTTADLTFSKTFTYGSDAEITIEAVYTPYADFYVNPNAENDDGNGATPYFAKRTLSGAMAIAKLADGCTVHAAPGVYREGGTVNAGSNRVVIAKKILLVGDGGAEQTFIEGVKSSLPEASNGHGTDSMRCVRLANAGAILKGFTITNGYVTAGQSGNNQNGGGVSGLGLVADCRIVCCRSSYRGSAAYGCTLLRCYIGNISANYTCYSGTVLIGCVHDVSLSAYSACTAYDSTFLKGDLWSSSTAAVNAYNCIFRAGLASSRPLALYSCQTTGSTRDGVTDMDGNCRFDVKAAALAVDTATYRPAAGSLAIDNGGDYRHLATNGWSAAWQAQYAGADYAGGQRVYNGRIDVGCGEFDWRGDFAKVLRRKAVSVDEMDPGVTTNGVATALVLSGGDTLVLTLTAKAAGPCSLTVVAADAAATVTANGAAVTPDANGVCTFQGREGENSVTVACAGEGTVTVSDVKPAKSGIALMIR